MKKHFILLAFAAALVSCKKDSVSTDFEATDVTGITIVKGNISKAMIGPDGNGGWNNDYRVPAKGVVVSVTVKKNALYPNSNAQGADVYKGLTDSLGNYKVDVRTNATGVAALITIEGFNGTQDTINNGIVKTGLNATFSNANISAVLVMGQSFTQNHHFFASPTISSLPLIKIGTAIVSGSIGIERLQETVIGPNPPFYNPVIVPFPSGHKVYLRLDQDPMTATPRTYETTTDGNGYYSFTVETVEMGTNGFNQDASIWIEDYAGSRDTIMINKTVKPGRKGVFKKETTFTNGLYNTSIRNGLHLSYTNFVQD